MWNAGCRSVRRIDTGPQNNGLGLNGRNSKHDLAQMIQGFQNIGVILGGKLNVDVSASRGLCLSARRYRPSPSGAPEKSACVVPAASIALLGIDGALLNSKERDQFLKRLFNMGCLVSERELSMGNDQRLNEGRQMFRRRQCNKLLASEHLRQS